MKAGRLAEALTVLLASAFLTVAAQCVSAAEAPAERWDTINRDDWGLTITLPVGWTEIPKASLDELTALLKSQTDLAHIIPYALGFQSTSGPPWMIYPYVVVQINNRHRIPEGEISKLRKLRPKLEEDINRSESALASILSEAKLGELTYDETNHLLWMRMQLNVHGIGTVNGLSGMKLTEAGYIQVNCYARAENFPAEVARFEKIIRSVTPSDQLVYKPRALDSQPWLSKLLDSRVTQNALIGALIGGIASVFLQFIKKRKPRGSPGVPPAGQ